MELALDEEGSRAGGNVGTKYICSNSPPLIPHWGGAGALLWRQESGEPRLL